MTDNEAYMLGLDVIMRIFHAKKFGQHALKSELEAISRIEGFEMQRQENGRDALRMPQGVLEVITTKTNLTSVNRVHQQDQASAGREHHSETG